MGSPASRQLALEVARRRTLLEWSRHQRALRTFSSARHTERVRNAQQILVRSISLVREHRTKLETIRIEGRIRRGLDDGRLPRIRPATVYGEPGHGGRCAACDGTLSAAQLMIEIVQAADGSPLCLHARCFMMWDAIRRPFRSVVPR